MPALPFSEARAFFVWGTWNCLQKSSSQFSRQSAPRNQALYWGVQLTGIMPTPCWYLLPRCRSYRRRLFWWFCRKGWPWRGGFEARTTPVQLLQRVVRNRVRNLIWHRWNCLTEEPLESFTDAVGRQLRTETLEYLEQGAKRGFLPRVNFHRCALFDLSGPYYASRASPPVNAGSLKARRHRDIQGRRPEQRLCLANQPDPIGVSADP